MPHVRIQHFAPALPPEALARLSSAIAASLREATGCRDEAISIAVQPVPASDWTDGVYEPEIVAEARWLVKHPGYGRLAESAS